MRVSKLFGKTLRDDPAEAAIASHSLMLRAGLIYQVSSGVYSYLPLAWRSLRKIEQIIREEMDATGGQELRLSVLQPQDLYDRSGRTAVFGPDLLTLTDRRERPLVMAPTHEEGLTSIVKANVSSYRDLPRVLYQIQTKFRDEERPRGGLLRVREFDMKDAYSFDLDDKGLDASYTSMVQAYENIFNRCGLSFIMVESDNGPMGGDDSHEFIAPADAGEDTIVLCDSCGYSANVERATFMKPPQPLEDLLALEEVHTPGIKTIEDLAEFLDVPESKTLKAVFYVADGETVVVTIRGDLEVNDTKLTNALGASELRLATPAEVGAAGLVAGSASAVGISDTKIVADDSVRLGANFVVGANRQDYHLRNANYPRDFNANIVEDIALAQEGYGCPNCKSLLAFRRGIEAGQVFKLGTNYSESMGAYYSDQNGGQRPVVMGSYGIGVGRLLAAAIEQSHDDAGIIFPAAIAPYHVWLMALNADKEGVSEAAAELYDALEDVGAEVLYDDRDESSGVKFNDADLLGLPVRVVVSPRNLKQGQVEVKLRSESEATMVPIAEAADRVKELLSD